MCGFAGFLSFRAQADPAARRALLQRMGDAIAHRGPDDERFHDDGHFALAFRRLAIMDARGGAQPFTSEDGRLVLAANGEIYNHTALRAPLRARHRFASESDCEVILHAWEERGERALDQLTGMFAIAVWNPVERTLVLARDRLGIKPLYYCELPDGLLFASELKALLAHPACPRQIDWHALDVPDTAQDPGSTYVRGVRMLEGGELLRARCDGRIERRRWWRLEDHLGRAPLGQDAAAYSQAYAELLAQVTREHLQGEAGMGIMLSGGLDSSLLAALAARHQPALPCFTIVERSSWLGGDVESARRLTQSRGLPWHPLRYDHRTQLRDLRFSLDEFERAVWMMDSPRFELEWIFKSELHRAAKRANPRLKVMLLGQGADEFAGGYSRRQDRPYASWREYLREEVGPQLAQRRAVADGGREMLRYLRAPEADEGAIGPYHRMMLLLNRQMQHYNLWHEDRTSSWHGIEARVPFLDHRLVELLAGVPGHLHEQLFWRKAIVRDASRRHAPDLRLPQEKLGFLQGEDTRSCDDMLAGIATRIYADFRERYGAQPDFDFDVQRLDTLAAGVAAGSAPAAGARQLIDCMAAAVFQARCSGLGAPASREERGGVRVVGDEEWDELQALWSAPLPQDHEWSAEDCVVLNGGYEVLVPSRSSAQPVFVIASADAVVGRLDAPARLSWVRDFLRHLGSPATQGFTVQDWLDELEACPSEFIPLLDLLAARGVIARRPSGARIATAAAALSA